MNQLEAQSGTINRSLSAKLNLRVVITNEIEYISRVLQENPKK